MPFLACRTTADVCIVARRAHDDATHLQRGPRVVQGAVGLAAA